MLSVKYVVVVDVVGGCSIVVVDVKIDMVQRAVVVVVVVAVAVAVVVE